MSGTTRRFRRHERLGDCELDRALVTFAERVAASAMGFCYRPTDVRWFRLDPGGIARGSDKEPIDLAGVFELRAFTADHELRWWSTSAQKGPAIVVSDEANQGRSADDASPWRLNDQPYERLLWGSVMRTSADGWVALYEARIGTLEVPVDGHVEPKSHVWLQAVEYATEDKYGNVAVVDERLTGLVSRARRSSDGLA